MLSYDLNTFFSAGRRDAVACLLLVLAVFAVYANVYPFAFLLDDQSLIITNQYLRDWHHIPDIFTHLTYAGAGLYEGFYRPVGMMLNLILFRTFGLSTAAFHALNVILQALNAGLMYRLGRKLGFNAGAVFAAALLWSVHPLHTNDITYISSLPEPLWTMFTLSGLLILLPDFTPRRICFSILLFMLALGSKETAVVFPALAAACLFITSRDRLKPSLYMKTWPFWLISVLYAVTYTHVNKYPLFQSTSPYLDTYADHIIVRILTCLATLPLYLQLIIYPTNLHMERFFPVFTSIFSGQVLAGAALALAALAQVILGKGKRGLPLSFGFFWFAAALSPVTGIVIPVDAMISEGWMYMPTIGLFLGVAQMGAVWIKGLKFKGAPVIAAAVVVVVALLLGVKTYSQNEVYRNPATFFGNIYNCGGNLSRSYADLGIYYLNGRDFDKSAEFFKLAVDKPTRNLPSAAMHTQLALAYIRVSTDEYYMLPPGALQEALPYTTQLPEAIDELNKALEIDPDFYFADTLLSIIYDWQGDREKAEVYHQKMLHILKKLGKIK